MDSNDYFRYYKDTVDRNNVCVAFISLPLHQFTTTDFEKEQRVSFAKHCQAIITAGENGRPDVSDNLNTLTQQCDKYLAEGTLLPDNATNLDTGLIDSTLIAWEAIGAVISWRNLPARGPTRSAAIWTATR